MILELGTVRSERHGLYRDARVWRDAPAQPERRPWWKRILRPFRRTDTASLYAQRGAPLRGSRQASR